VGPLGKWLPHRHDVGRQVRQEHDRDPRRGLITVLLPLAPASALAHAAAACARTPRFEIRGRKRFGYNGIISEQETGGIMRPCSKLAITIVQFFSASRVLAEQSLDCADTAISRLHVGQRVFIGCWTARPQPSHYTEVA